MCSRFDWAISIWAVYPKAVTVSLHNALVSAERAGLQFDFIHCYLLPARVAPGLSPYSGRNFLIRKILACPKSGCKIRIIPAESFGHQQFYKTFSCHWSLLTVSISRRLNHFRDLTKMVIQNVSSSPPSEILQSRLPRGSFLFRSAAPR